MAELSWGDLCFGVGMSPEEYNLSFPVYDEYIDLMHTEYEEAIWELWQGNKLVCPYCVKVITLGGEGCSND